LRPLADMLFGQTRGRILALLFDVPDRMFYGREIARLTNSSSGTVRRELDNLTHFGLVLKSTTGRQVFYRANSFHPVFNEMQSVLAKTAGIYHILRRALEPLAEQIDFAIVYGSTVRGDSLADSDIDIMVIGDATLDEVLLRLGPVENTLGRPVNPTTFSLQEFEAKLQSGNHFLSAVLRGKKIVLMGDEDEFAKMGGVRLASR
jgi:predicted nucleotidyltransferase